MLFLEPTAGAENVWGNIVDSGLEYSSGGLGDSVNILVGYSACAEDASVCEPLSGEVTDGEFGEDDVGANVVDFL